VHAAELFRVLFAVSGGAAALALAAASIDRLSRRLLYVMLALVFAATAAAWIFYGLRTETSLAVSAGGLTTSFLVLLGAGGLKRGAARAKRVDETVQSAETRLRALIEREAEVRTAELERVLARARADSLSLIAEEERRIVEERRAAIAEREREAARELAEALAATQHRVEQRLTEWGEDLERAQAQLVDQLTRLAGRQKRLISEAEERLSVDAERLESESEAQRAALIKLREDLERATAEAIATAGADLDTHGADRRRALHELSERLRRRERELRESIEREETEAMQRLQAMFTDVERRLTERLERVVERTTGQHAEAATIQFAEAIKSSREEAGRRLSRELDRAVQAFTHEAEQVIAERLANVGEVAAQRLDRRLAETDAAVGERRDVVAAALELRFAGAEQELRDKLEALAADSEAARAVLEARLHELQRRLDNALAQTHVLGS
jgi:hypothetical protein